MNISCVILCDNKLFVFRSSFCPVALNHGDAIVTSGPSLNAVYLLFSTHRRAAGPRYIHVHVT